MTVNEPALPTGRLVGRQNFLRIYIFDERLRAMVLKHETGIFCFLLFSKRNKSNMGWRIYISKQNNNHVLLKKMTLTDMHKRQFLCKSVTNLL